MKNHRVARQSDLLLITTCVNLNQERLRKDSPSREAILYKNVDKRYFLFDPNDNVNQFKNF